MLKDRPALIALSTLVTLTALGCTSSPPPATVYDDQLTIVQLRADGRMAAPYNHPAQISTQMMTTVLNGIRVQRWRDPIIGLASRTPEPQPGFSTSEIEVLAPQLSRALAAASPQELVTFYRRLSNAHLGLGVTSGGLFVSDHYLYFLLANHWNRPADVMSQALTYEIDPFDDPLFSLRPRSFITSFTHDEAVAAPRPSSRLAFPDTGQFIVIDLRRLPS